MWCESRGTRSLLWKVNNYFNNLQYTVIFGVNGIDYSVHEEFRESE